MQQPLNNDAITFLAERHLATLTTVRADGTPHVVPVGFSYDAEAGVARVITFASATKAINAASRARAAVCQVDGGRWITLEGVARVSSQPAAVATAVAMYTARYREPKQRTDRVVIEINVDRIMGSAAMKAS